jgi:hypothetical protein
MFHDRFKSTSSGNVGRLYGAPIVSLLQAIPCGAGYRVSIFGGADKIKATRMNVGKAAKCASRDLLEYSPSCHEREHSTEPCVVSYRNKVNGVPGVK